MPVHGTSYCVNRPVNHRGFTLIDLLIVIMIMGILGSIAFPQFHSMRTEATLNGATGEVVSALHYARSLAITYQRPFEVKVYVASSRNQFMVKDTRYAADTGAHSDDEPPVYTNGRIYNPIDKMPYIIDFDELQQSLVGVVPSRTEYRGVDIVSVPGGGNDGTIRFYPDGHSSETDSVIVLGMGDRQRTITVDGLTGRVMVN